ncbi:hypothetical protein F5Y16DRAFT_408389 [Xylariaceae sp. FL0255]|nr:hypothetical protein F5Y16DRAFT_408389 [Xylariaceae sp. FL0255]
MDSRSGRVEKRNRPPVSCEPCRTRKLKCNRGLPCETCIKRQKTSQCHYAANANRNASAVSKQREMRERLNTLENLVSSFVSGENIIQSTSSRRSAVAAATTEPSDTAHQQTQQGTRSLSELMLTPESDSIVGGPLTPERPHLQQNGEGQVNYIDSNHWQSILNDIQEIREHISSPIQQFPLYEYTPADASFLFGTQPTLSYSDILCSLPPQAVCDRLVSWYLGLPFLVSGIVHPEKFQKEYDAFWAAPTETSPLWTALLFSILALATGMRRISQTATANDLIPPAQTLQQMTVQCLVLGRYATANAYALEALLIHLVSFLVTKGNSSTALWFEMGTIIRLSFRMGYHRDPSTLPRISVFDGEMRRRLWFNIVHIEALMSAQMGFPSMIPTDFCDAKLPRNLEYSDLQVDMVSLPPGRPLSQSTPIRYSIVKDSVMSIFKKIAAHTQSLTIPAHEVYRRTVALRYLHEGYDELPEVMKRRDVNRSSLDSLEIIIERCTIELLFLQGLIILHRRYVNFEPESERFEFSRRACIEAALDILARQEDIYKACQPGGRLYDDRWLVYGLPSYALLLAAMVICLDLSVCMRLRGMAAEKVNNHDLQDRERKALRTSQQLWASLGDFTPEAPVASQALELMIRKVDDHFLAHSAFPIPRPQYEELITNPIPSFHYAGAMSQVIDGLEDLDWVSP